MHALLHRELTLSAGQEKRIHAIEAKFATRRTALELEMRAANIRLAQAIEAEHGYGPLVTKAIDDTHEVMGELQKETLQHLFAMRAVLDREQAAWKARIDDYLAQRGALLSSAGSEADHQAAVAALRDRLFTPEEQRRLPAYEG